MVARMFLVSVLATAFALRECDGDSCPATNLAQPPTECRGDSCPAVGLAGPPGLSGGSETTESHVRKTGSTAEASSKQPVNARGSAAAAGPHVVVLHDSAAVKLDELHPILVKLGVSDQSQTTKLIQQIKQKRFAIVVEGHREACDRVAAMFEAGETAKHLDCSLCDC